MKRLVFASALFVGASLLAGCGSTAPPLPSQAKVGGTVTFDGKPMPEGEVRFTQGTNPTQTVPVKDGAFAGSVFAGKNTVEVVWEKDGGPHPMDPNIKLKVNAVASRFTGGGAFQTDIPEAGKTDLKYDVASK